MVCSGAMSKGEPFTAEQVATIGQLLEAGASYNAIGRQLGTEHGRIATVASSLGMDRAYDPLGKTAKMRDAAVLSLAVRRMRMLERFQEHLEAYLRLEPGSIPSKDFRDLAVSMGIGIDKQRLEEGQSTSNRATSIRVWGPQPVAELPPPPD